MKCIKTLYYIKLYEFMSLMTGKHVIKSYKMNHFKITINIIHLLKKVELFYVYLHAI